MKSFRNFFSCSHKYSSSRSLPFSLPTRFYPSQFKRNFVNPSNSLFTEEMDHFLLSFSTLPSDPVLKLIEEETERVFPRNSHMMMGAYQLGFLQMFTQLSQTQSVVELGTFTGYSALGIAGALPSHGKILTCDIDRRAVRIAQQFWPLSEHGAKIELQITSAENLLSSLSQSFDMAILDADKKPLWNYFETLVERKTIKSNGWIVVDNILGRSARPKTQRFLLGFLEKVKEDPRVDHWLLPIRDGLLLLRVK